MVQAIRRWETEQRYFEIRIYEDLFGQRVLEAINGGLRSKLGMTRVVAVGDQIEAAVREIERRRSGHGYAELCLMRPNARPLAQATENGRVTGAKKRVGHDKSLTLRGKLRDRVVQDDVVHKPKARRKLANRKLARQLTLDEAFKAVA